MADLGNIGYMLSAPNLSGDILTYYSILYSNSFYWVVTSNSAKAGVARVRIDGVVKFLY